MTAVSYFRIVRKFARLLEVRRLVRDVHRVVGYGHRITIDCDSPDIAKMFERCYRHIYGHEAFRDGHLRVNVSHDGPYAVPLRSVQASND